MQNGSAQKGIHIHRNALYPPPTFVQSRQRNGRFLSTLKILLSVCNFCVAFLKAVWYDRMRWGIAPMEIYDTNGR